jgi:mono/diheme cytochrome c family protein
MVDASDAKFTAGETRSQLESLGASGVEECREPADSGRLPRIVFVGLAVCASLALIPPLWIARVRATTSEAPRLHGFRDMDFQPKFKSQTTTTLLPDGSAMRPPVAGTIARGQLREDDRLHRGVKPENEAVNEDGGPSGEPAEPGQQAEAGNDGSPDPRGEKEPNWTEVIPSAIPVTSARMDRGQQCYNIFCAACHGQAGDGNGLVSLRALELEQGTWLTPTSIHIDEVRKHPVGKLFNTVTNGVRKMPGYAGQIATEDRWAIVLYLRALQRSRSASPDDVPAEELDALRRTK